MADGLLPGGLNCLACLCGCLVDVAGEVDGIADVDVEAGAAQRCGDDTGELLDPPAGDDPARTDVSDRDDGRAGGEREAGQTGTEGAGSVVGGVPAAGSPPSG